MQKKENISKDPQEIQEQYQELELHNQDDHDQVENSLLEKDNQNGIKSFFCSTPMKILISILFAIIIFVAAVVINMQVQDKQESQWIDVQNQIIIKEGDQANYELLTLKKNKLRILLITQKDIKLSGASLDVLVGSQSNPTEFQGLAHLLEHMLFMGSEKYPQEDAFNTILSKSIYQKNSSNHHLNLLENASIEFKFFAEQHQNLNMFCQFSIKNVYLFDKIQQEKQNFIFFQSNKFFKQYFYDVSIFKGNIYLLKNLNTSYDNNKFNLCLAQFNNILYYKKGGSSNAYTAGGNTNYHFQGTHNNLIEILNVWSRFFIDPLLLEDQLQREVQAVDSEYFNTLTREGFRDFNLMINLSEDNHPFKQFYCGNTDSLLNTPKSKGLSTYEALRSFKKKYYYSENMFLVIKSDESQREKLKDQLENIFQDIPTQEQNMLNFTQKDQDLIQYSYKATNKPPITLGIQSISIENNKIKKLNLVFLLEEDNNSEYLSLQFVRDLFIYGFEETNFCFFVEDRKLGTECSIEVDQEQSKLNKFLSFTITLQFLDSEDTIEDIIKAYFYFINAVANYPKKQETYNAIKAIQESLFDIIDDENQRDVMSEVIQYSRLMNQNRMKDLLAENTLYKSYNETHFSKIMSILTDPSRIIIIHKTNNSTYVEGKKIIRDELNDLNYTISQIPLQLQNKFRENKSLKIPKIYPLQSFGSVPDKLIKNVSSDDDDSLPKLIHQSNRGKIFSKKDIYTFKKPIQTIFLKFQSNVFLKDASSRGVNEILVNYLSDELKRKTQLLEFQKLKIEAEPTRQEGGILIKITCLNSQVKEIFKKVQKVFNLQNQEIYTNEAYFEEYRQKLIDKLNNFKNQMVYQQFIDLFNSYHKANSYSKTQILEVASLLRQSDSNQIIDQFLKDFNLVVYVFGDIDKNQIVKQFDMLTKSNADKEQPYVYQTQFIDFKNNPVVLQLYYESGDRNNNLCSNYYQLGKLNSTEYAMLKLIEKPLRNKAFDYLRTQLQLGYVVTAQILKSQEYYGLFILVQGSKHTPNQYDQHIEEFLPLFEDYLESLSDEEIGSMQQSLIQSLRIDQFDRFKDKADNFWTFVDDMTYDFDLNLQTIQILQEELFRNEDLSNFFVKFFKNSNSRFSVQLFSPSKIKQSDLPMKQINQKVYSGDVGKYVTFREDFQKLQMGHLNFKEQQKTF